MEPADGPDFLQGGRGRGNEQLKKVLGWRLAHLWERCTACQFFTATKQEHLWFPWCLRTRVLSWWVSHPALLGAQLWYCHVLTHTLQQGESRADTSSWATAARTPQCFIHGDIELHLNTHLPDKSFYIPLPWPAPAGPPSQSVPFKFTRKERTRKKDTLLLHFFK